MPTLTKRIINSYTQFTFVHGDTFYWSANNKTITYATLNSAEDVWTIFHEIAHAVLLHHHFDLDVALLKQETEAWAFAARHIAPRFGLAIDEDFAQDNLDTYRQWLYDRSICPTCKQTGLQTKNTYQCINCRCSWRANDARLCALRRTKLLVQDQTE